jgi:hypothetical protein
MALSDIVSVVISAQTQAVTAPGFGVPLILGYHTKFAELTRSYTSLAGMITDGFALTDPEYLAATAMQAQSPAPPRWVVGRRTHIPTKVVELTPTQANSTVYTVIINGVAFSYTSDASATKAEIITGLVSAIGSPTGVTPSDYSSGTSLRLTGTAGTWFSCAVSDSSGSANSMGLWTVADITADSSADTDIAACAAADSSWYAFMVTHQNAIDGAELATWAQANKRLFCIDIADSAIKTSATSDLAYVVNAASQEYAIVSYHAAQSEFMSAAWLGKCLPMEPGSETWKFKTLDGVSADILSDSEVGYIKGKNANWYQVIGGVSITQNGTSGGGDFIDNVRFIDWLKTNMQYDVYDVLVNNNKVPYTDAGVAMVESRIRSRLNIGVDVGGLSSDPAPTVTVPRVSSETTANRANRTIPDIYFTATLAGAIHSVTINGTVSV